ncbi:amidohydrolase family protein [Aurantiacibacter odishensis]|uniref:amidohydrolase family protein n=1 Tax=Aurantiacibacter odishensis TaxID=1155476 RepID=UPI000E70B9D3|nr:amidohydrolase family protein [Aurantiacibacter odishensis]
MMKTLLVPLGTAALCLPAIAMAQDGDPQRPYTGPVIDVHLHASGAEDNGPAPNGVCPGMAADLRYTGDRSWPAVVVDMMLNPACENPILGPATDEEVMEQTIAEMERRNVIGILSSSAEDFATWSAAAPGSFMRGHALNIDWEDAPPPAEIAEDYDAGEFAVLAEVTNQYGGILADDPSFAPYWAMAEERGIPVGIHIGNGPPGAHSFYPQFRIQSPLQLEEVLRAHPRLRVYVMHAGYPFADEMKALFYYFPQLMVDVGVLQLALTREEYHAFLQDLTEAGFTDRIMFGSDQMNWPGMIGEGIDAINDAPFLTHEQKKAILHDNATRFFAPELAAMRGGD